MTSKCILSASIVVCTGAFAAPTLAQVPFAFYTLQVTEVHAGTTTPVTNPNGLIEPGEGALFQMTVTFEPPVGTIVQSVEGPGPVVGFAGVGARVIRHASIGATGEWTHLALAPGWGPPVNAGYAVGDDVWGIVPFQWPHLTGTVNPANPIVNIWQGVWTPFSYEARTTNWNVDSGSGGPVFGSLWVEYGTDPTTGDPLLAGAHIRSWHTPVIQVHIVPVPAAPSSLLLLASLTARRRRSRTSPVSLPAATLQLKS